MSDVSSTIAREFSGADWPITVEYQNAGRRKEEWHGCEYALTD
jgi:hypothetical protein